MTPPLLDLHAARWVDRDHYHIREDAKRFENWEYYVAGRIGLAEAVEYALQWGVDAIWERVRRLADELRVALARIPGVKIRDLGVNKCAIVTFTMNGVHPDKIRLELKKERINVSVSPPEYTLIDMERRRLSDGLVRASVHYYNTSEEIERLTEAVGKTTR